MATKEQIIADRTFATERYILSTMPVLYLPLWKLDGGSFISSDGHGHTATVTGATKVFEGRDFLDDTPDFIELPASSTQLNFTTGAFSIIMTAKLDALAGIVELFCRGAFNTDGWRFAVSAAGALFLATNQTPAANQSTDSADGTITTATWYTLGASRDGAAVKMYIDGADATDTAPGHGNPTTSARKSYIGVYDDESSNPLDGIIGEVIVYNRALSTAEHADVHRRLKWMVQ